MKPEIQAATSLLVACLALAPALAAAAPSAARFEEMVANTSGADVNLPEHLVIDQADFHGEATTNAVGVILPGGSPPYVEAIVLHDTSSPLETRAFARVEYYFVVEGPPLPDEVAAVPVIIDAKLLVEADLVGVMGGDIVFASISVLPPDADSEIVRINGCSNIEPVCSAKSANPSFEALMIPGGAQGKIDMIASIYYYGAFGWIGLRAVADPYIYVDPAFAYAGDYRIVVSAGVGNAPPVPEPSTLWLAVAGLAVLCRRRARGIVCAWRKEAT